MSELKSTVCDICGATIPFTDKNKVLNITIHHKYSNIQACKTCSRMICLMTAFSNITTHQPINVDMIARYFPTFHELDDSEDNTDE